MAAATVSVTHNTNTKTIVYTFSAAVDFELVAGGGTNVVLSEMVAASFAFYKTALDGTYAAPAAENVDTNCTIVSVSGNAGNTILTIVYSGVFPTIDHAAFGYICYPILYFAADIATSTDSSANHIQCVFTTPVVVPITKVTSRNAETESSAALACSTSSGATYAPTKQDEKCVLIFTNTDSGNAEEVTIYKGDGQQGVVDLTFSIAASGTSFVVLESGRHKFLEHDGLTGKYYMEATSDVKIQALELI